MPQKMLGSARGLIGLFPLLLVLSGCDGSSGGASIFNTENDNTVNLTSTSAGLCAQTDTSAQALSGYDNLLTQQWYLQNTGQKSFSQNAGTAGEDINLPSSLWQSVTGKGVRVAVLDTCIDMNHPDLIANLDTTNSVDFSKDAKTGDHATSVAGIIAASKDNGRGGAGIAPEATLQGFSIINSDNAYSKWSQALGHSGTQAANVAIFNQSFGYGNVQQPYPYDTTFESYYLNGVQNLRSGKGALYFKSAGNSFGEFGACTGLNTNDYGLPCQNANMDPDNNIPYNMIVAAVNAKGKASSYSSSGSSVIFSAPGGEYGVNHPAIIAPDDLDNNTSVNGETGYTHKFNGTSSAAPMASGVAALILEANPALGWRDVRHIMLTTADPIDTAIPQGTLDFGGGNILVTEPAWQTNNAGYRYHNWYGFGRINAANAVAAAQSYGSNLPVQQTQSTASGTVNLSIPDASTSGVSHSFTIADADKLTVESVQLKLNISHSYLSDLQIELTSPSGMKSVLMTPLNAMAANISNQEIVLLSQAFYGENSAGSWTLTLYDVNSGDTGSLNSATLKIFGH